MADEFVVSHKAFSGVVDSFYVDVEDIQHSPISTLDECQNLTSFRKLGGAKQVAGFSSVFTTAQLPSESNYGLTGFEPYDMYIFGLDKDQKEIYLLVYKNSSNQTRFFINTYWNPDVTFSNCNINKQSNAWVAEWMELTESMSDTLLAISSDYAVTMQNNFATRYPNSNVDDYLNGFFIVNLTKGRANRFNYITDWDKTSKIATVKAKIRTSVTGSDWAIGDSIKIYRFPVCHHYKAETNSYIGEGETFDAIPTDFNYRDNQLRIACGKNNRPLILDFIHNRKYFLGNDNSMSYEGFWFDFQSIPQVMRNSAITGFKTRSGGTSGGTSWDIQTGTLNTGNGWTTAAAGRVNISCYSGTMQVNLAIIASADPFPVTYNLIPNKVGIKTGTVGANNFLIPTIYFKPNLSASLTAADFVSAFNSGANPFYPQLRANLTAAGDIDTVNYTGSTFPVALALGTKTFISETGTIFSGIEAGGNDTALNLFLGMGCNAIDSSANEIVQRNLHILNIVVDNRSQILLSHGTYSAKNNAHGLQVRATPWFSRRITGLSLFNQKVEDTTNAASGLASYVIAQEKYPYFLYRKEMGSTAKLNINELKHHQQYDIYDFVRGINGELIRGIEAASVSSNGTNMYTYDPDAGYWYVYFRTSYNGIATDGKGMKYVAKCNRYIDQDTTMNYERCSFVGQTNGRYFLIGVKNTIGEQPFESNDLVVYNIYAGAVSEYDTFLRDRFMVVAFGDKDQLRAIENFNGYLFLAKDNNSFALEVNTDNEIKYRTIDTHLGRGVSNPKLMLQTPYGIIMATEDGVWVIDQQGSERILTPDNGKLDLYKTLFNSNVDSQIFYSKKHNELYVYFQTVTDVIPSTYTSYIFIYSFEEKKWGGYYYLVSSENSGTKPYRFRENTTREIVFFNYDKSPNNLTRLRIDKINDASYQFIKPSGATYPIVFKMKTHLTPYGGRMQDTLLQKLTLLYDTAAITNKSLTIKIYRDNLTATTYTLTLPNTASALKNQITELIGKLDGVASVMAFSIENDENNDFGDFVINGVDLWLAKQQRRKI